MMAVDSFMKINGRSRFFAFEEEEEREEKPKRKRVAFSTRGYSDLYKSEEEPEKKGAKK